ncbi:MAG: prepilin-type N-terminal cleavage/methylation domain-containing protein [Brevundimonas sp.]|jgi:prepilin-type N-terminal cleavage/methylation domain-containing protein|nr:prepilin-type N-terminal cleavage/methylation domain-containing protein [Brevundimonas sp.]
MRSQRKKGFTLVEIMIVVLIIGILLGIAVPNFITARQDSRAQTIVATLEKIDAAKEQCAMDEGLSVGDDCSSMGAYLRKWPATWPMTGATANETTVGTPTTFRGRNAATWRTDKSGL